MKKVIYTALFVDNPGVLKSLFPPIYSNQYYHHSTIEFNPKDVSNIEVGKKLIIRAIGRITTDRVDALLVENPLSKNVNPHITLSTAAGVKPFESNVAFKKHPNFIVRFKEPISIKVTEGYYQNNQDVK